AEPAHSARESHVATPEFPTLFSCSDRQLSEQKVIRTQRTREVFRKGNVGAHSFQLNCVAGLDDDRDSFIRTDVFCDLCALFNGDFSGSMNSRRSSYVPETTRTISPLAGCAS